MTILMNRSWKKKENLFYVDRLQLQVHVITINTVFVGDKAAPPILGEKKKKTVKKKYKKKRGKKIKIK